MARRKTPQPRDWQSEAQYLRAILITALDKLHATAGAQWIRQRRECRDLIVKALRENRYG